MINLDQGGVPAPAPDPRMDYIKRMINAVISMVSDQEALELLQEIETYVHDWAEEIIAELEERRQE